MATQELFYTGSEVAAIFRLTPSALNSRRKRGTEPGSFAVKVGGTYLYPKNLIDQYLARLARGSGATSDVETIY